MNPTPKKSRSTPRNYFFARTPRDYFALIATLLALSFNVGADETMHDETRHDETKHRPQIMSLRELMQVTVLEVDTTTDNGYHVQQVITGSRVAVDLMDFPMPVTVLTEEFMDDLAMDDAEDAVNYIASTNKQAGERDGEVRSVRGFSGFQTPSLRNGMKVQFYSDSVNWSRIEAVKGATSVMYGQTGPGGILNYITKKPTFEPRHTAYIRAGSYQSKRAEIELNGPVPLFDGKKLAYRYSGAFTQHDTEEQFEHLDKRYHEVSMMWRITEHANLTLDYEILKRDWNPNQGPALKIDPDGSFAHDRSNLGAGPNGAKWRGPAGYFQNDTQLKEVTFDLLPTQHITYRFSYLSAYYERRVHVRDPIFRFTGAVPLSAGDIDVANGQPLSHIGRYSIPTRLTIEKYDTWQARHDINFDIELGRSNHSLTFTADIFRLTGGENSNAFVLDWKIVPPWDPNNPSKNAWDGTGIFNDDHLTVGWPKHPSSAFGDLSVQYSRIGYDAVSFNGFSSLYGKKLHLVWGARHDRAINPKVKENIWQLGAIYKASNNISPFISYGTTFKNNGFGRNQEVLTPEVGNSLESGLKFDYGEGELTGSLSYFSAEREKVLRVADIFEGGTKIGETSATSGAEISAGFDMDLIFIPFENWQTLISASIFDHEVEKNSINPSEEGLPLRFSAGKMVSAFTKYKFISGSLAGLTLGIGSNYRDSIRVGGTAQPYSTDGRLVFDALIGFTIPTKDSEFSINLQLHNITDKNYADRWQGWGDPFTATLGLRLTL
jgi:iron complex outermembrane recepter protein